MTDPSLRIAIFADSYLPYLSGVTVSTEALARGLAAAGHAVLLVAPQPARGTEPGTAGAVGPQPAMVWLPSLQLPPPAPRGYRVPRPIGLLALAGAAAFAPQVVHAQSPFLAGRLASGVARRARAPLVFTHHTRFADYRHYLGLLARPGAALVDRQLLQFWRTCDALIAPGRDLAAEIKARLQDSPRPLVRVIPTGIEVAEIAALPRIDPRPLAGWPADSLVIASLGRLAAEKSVDQLLAAFRLAAAQEARLRLLLIGGGPSAAALRDAVRQQGLGDKVALVGQRPRLEALALLKGSDLFAFASRTETQGLVVAEALTCGLPVVAIDAPGTRDAVRHERDGILVAGDSPDAAVHGLGEALLAVSADAARRVLMGAEASAGASRFDRAVAIGEVVALYRELLAGR